ncbi:Type I restriction-modification system, specificity subunit S [Candidatus Nitrotoga sp. HW29]|nr:Type I restriction-modification system, specificity subunit S [Candidatus Nitrotoga sp. HW29]
MLNGSPLFTGGTGFGESEIRRYMLENDLVEAITGLPTDMLGTKIQLSLDDVRDLPNSVPPLGEQIQITVFLDNELVKFDTLTIEAQRAIYLLQERRTALISAAGYRLD